MTDKIIIDGVDVSGCEFFYKGEISDGCLLGYREDPVNNYNSNCQDNNCYYKQLQKTRNAYSKLNNLYNDNCEIIGELEDILKDIKTIVTTDYIQIKKQLVQNYDCLDNFMQKIEAKCSEVID